MPYGRQTRGLRSRKFTAEEGSAIRAAAAAANLPAGTGYGQRRVEEWIYRTIAAAAGFTPAEPRG